MVTTSAADSLAAAATSGQGVVAWYAQGFSDGLGDRLLLFDNTGAPPLELLRLAERLTANQGFEPALREQVERLKPFRHPAFARVRGVTVLSEPVPQLALVSEHIPGERLSTILHAAEAAGFRPDPSTGVWLVRQLLSALSALHAMGTGIAHGLLTPERIVVTPAGDLVVTEYVLGQALDRIAAPRELWKTLGVALDPEIEAERSAVTVDPGKDVQQVALLALAVLLGRPLREGEFPARVAALLDDACDRARWSFVGPLRAWLARALAEKAEWRFESASEAVQMLDRLLPQIQGTWSPGLRPQALRAPDTESPAGTASPGSAPPLLASAPLEGRSALADASPRRPTRTAAAPATAAAVTAAPISIFTVASEPAPGWRQRLIGAIEERGLIFAALAGAEAICLAALLSGAAARGPAASDDIPTLAAGALPAPIPPMPAVSDLVPVDTRPGWIAVSTPRDAEVQIVGVSRSRGREVRVPLDAGPYRVVVTDLASGARETMDVDVKPGQGVALEPDFASVRTR
ncbi:MAG TPA: hypothetical protein VIL25_06715 [Vicinamibacterales bacterium]